MGKPTDRNSLANKSYKNNDKGEFGQNFRKIIDVFENYIYGLLNRIFNIVTKPQKQFYLRVFPLIFFYIFFCNFILYASYLFSYYLHIYNIPLFSRVGSNLGLRAERNFKGIKGL